MRSQAESRTLFYIVVLFIWDKKMFTITFLVGRRTITSVQRAEKTWIKIEIWHHCCLSIHKIPAIFVAARWVLHCWSRRRTLDFAYLSRYGSFNYFCVNKWNQRARIRHQIWDLLSIIWEWHDFSNLWFYYLKCAKETYRAVKYFEQKKKL